MSAFARRKNGHRAASAPTLHHFITLHQLLGSCICATPPVANFAPGLMIYLFISTHLCIWFPFQADWVLPGTTDLDHKTSRRVPKQVYHVAITLSCNALRKRRSSRDVCVQDHAVQLTARRMVGRYKTKLFGQLGSSMLEALIYLNVTAGNRMTNEHEEKKPLLSP
jgi:hypothetical protein